MTVDAAQLADLTAEALLRKRAVRATSAGYTADPDHRGEGTARVLVTLDDGSRWELTVEPR